MPTAFSMITAATSSSRLRRMSSSPTCRWRRSSQSRRAGCRGKFCCSISGARTCCSKARGSAASRVRRPACCAAGRWRSTSMATSSPGRASRAPCRSSRVRRERHAEEDGGQGRQAPARSLPRCARRAHRGRPHRGQRCGRRGRPAREVDCADDLAHWSTATVRFGFRPHIGIRSDEDEEMGESPWTISS